MPYKWRATYSFDYPLLDVPVEIGEIRLYPAPPELDMAPHAIHCYEFVTSQLDRGAQLEAKELAFARLEELAELSVLCPNYTEVGLQSLVLIDADNLAGFPPTGVNFNVSSKPYLPPGASPKGLRESLLRATQPFVGLQSLGVEHRDPISRALRWLYRGNDYRIPADDKLIYGWIAFNSLYSLFNLMQKKPENPERASVREFEEFFRVAVNSATDEARHLAASGLRLSRGRNLEVSEILQQSIDRNDGLVGLGTLDCIYAARCSLFHGAERPEPPVSNSTMVVAAKVLHSYVKRAVGPFIAHCLEHA